MRAMAVINVRVTSASATHRIRDQQRGERHSVGIPVGDGNAGIHFTAVVTYRRRFL